MVDQKDHSPQEVTAESQVARLFAWRRGFNAMHLIDLGIRLELFKALAETPGMTAQQVADRLGLHAPHSTHFSGWEVPAHTDNRLT